MFFVGPNEVGAQLGRLREAAGVEGALGEAGAEGGSKKGRREQAMECRIELSVQVMIRRRRCGHVRNEFHAC